MTRHRHPTFRVTLEALPAAVPVPSRIRALLKHALRSLSLRCRSVEEVPPAGGPAPAADGSGRPGDR
ncbi:MAG TPA: hypothetical protein VJ739_16615 [Gemmataceae bacterium]|nr:hypothetical protein [Gemmataceae bacterium]